MSKYKSKYTGREIDTALDAFNAVNRYQVKLTEGDYGYYSLERYKKYRIYSPVYFDGTPDYSIEYRFINSLGHTVERPLITEDVEIDPYAKYAEFTLIQDFINADDFTLTVIYEIDGKRYEMKEDGEVRSMLDEDYLRLDCSDEVWRMDEDISIKALSGDSVFIRYSAYEDGTDFTEDWAFTQKYIGIATGTSAPTTKDGYIWCRFIGNSTSEGETSPDVEVRLNNIEQWIFDKNYVPMTIPSISVTPSSVEYGGSVNEVTLTWTVDKEVSAFSIIFPGGTTAVDVTDKVSYNDETKTFSYTDNTLYENVKAAKKWKIIAKRKDGKMEDVDADISMSCPYSSIKFTSLIMDPSTTRYEHGSSIDEITLYWSLSKPSKLTEVICKCGTTTNRTTLEDPEATECTVQGPFTSSTEFIVEATEEIGKDFVATGKKAIEFYYLVYWGVGTQPDKFTDDFITSLTDQPVETTTQARTFNITATNQYIYYAVPQALVDSEGKPTFKMDDGFAGGFDFEFDANVEKQFGDNIVKIPYRIYRSDQPINDTQTKVDITVKKEG